MERNTGVLRRLATYKKLYINAKKHLPNVIIIIIVFHKIDVKNSSHWSLRDWYSFNTSSHFSSRHCLVRPGESEVWRRLRTLQCAHLILQWKTQMRSHYITHLLTLILPNCLSCRCEMYPHGTDTIWTMFVCVCWWVHKLSNCSIKMSATFLIESSLVSSQKRKCTFHQIVP